MEIVETSIYTQDITKLLSDEEYQELQKYLVKQPKSGDIIPGSPDLTPQHHKTKLQIATNPYFKANSNLV